MSALRELMSTPLPSKIAQKKMKFTPTRIQLTEIYQILNDEIFANELSLPSITLRSLKRAHYGECICYSGDRHYCKLRMSRRYPTIQWFIMILAHEMVHQYQWMIHGPNRIIDKKKPLLSHGPSFFQFRDRLNNFKIPLKISYCEETWFRFQNLMRI